MEFPRVVLARSPSQLVTGLLEAAAWAGFGIGALVLGAMLNPFTGGGMTGPAVFAAVCLIGAVVTAWMGFAQGSVEVRPDELVVRRSASLARPLHIPRRQVARVLVDDGSSAGEARFATGDPAEPFLWSGGPGRRRPRPNRDVRPNVALMLDPPITVAGPRSDPAVTVAGKAALPWRRAEARVVFLAVVDPEAASAALAAWPLSRPDPVPVLPPQLRAPNGQIPQGFATVSMGGAVVVVLLTLAGLPWLIPVWFVLMIPVVAGILRRHREGAAAAMAAAGDDPAAVEAVRANWGHAFTEPEMPNSFGPPGS